MSSGLFGKLGDKNSTAKSPQSGPASLSSERHARKSFGLFAGVHQDGGDTFNGNSTPKGPFTNCTSSPIHVGRSLREFEEQMAALRKENFNLKLRIYFLEEKPEKPSSSSSSNIPAEANREATHKQIIDLKVENESLRKELEEKQSLLCEASQAMELMESDHKKQSNEANMMIEDLNHKIESMTYEIKNLEKALFECSRSGDVDFSEFLGAVSTKDIEAQRKIADFEHLISNFSDQNEQLCQKIESMESDRTDLITKFNELQYENAELKEKLFASGKTANENELKKLHDECYDSKRKLADVLTHYEDVEKKLNEKTEAHEKSLQVIKRACEHIDDLEIHVEQLKSNQPSSLSSTESAKNDEIFTHANSLILKLREQVEHITNDKDEEIKRLKEELNSRSKFTSMITSSHANSLNFSQQLQNIDFPTNEKSFNEIIEQNRTASKKIHFLKQRLNSHTQNKIEVEFLQLQLKEAQNEVQESESALRRSATFCGILLDRLEELTTFLSSLLQKDDVVGRLGVELRKAIVNAVDRTLDISRNFTKSIQNESISHLSDCSMIDLVDSLASSTIADEQSFIDSLRSDYKPTPTDSLVKSKSNSLTSSRLQRSQKSLKKSSGLFTAHSDDEEWSEPDRDVSAQRIGLKTDDPVTVKRSTTTSDEDNENDFGADHKLIKKSEWTLIQGKIKSLETLLSEKNDKILEVSGMLLDSENDAKEKLTKMIEKLDEAERDVRRYRDLYQQTSIEVCELRETLQQTKSQKDQLNVEIRVMNSKLESQLDDNRKQREKFQSVEEQLHKVSIEYETKCNLYEKLVMASEKREEEFRDELQVNWIRKTIYNQLLHELDKKKDKLKEYQHKFSLMEDEMKNMQSHVIENEEKFEKISKNLDTATLQLSSASIERSKALNEKRSLDTKLKKITEEFSKLNIEKQELNLKIADLEVFNAKLQNKLLTGEKLNAQKNISSEYGSGYASEEANAANRSPSISSNDEKEINANCPSCQRLRNDVCEMRKSMQHSKRSLELAYAKLRNQNLKKAQTEMDIKQQIMKTQNVLQNVRTNMENEMMTRSALTRTDDK